MARKKQPKTPPESELEHEVDQMMDPNLPDLLSAPELADDQSAEAEKTLVIDEAPGEPASEPSADAAQPQPGQPELTGNPELDDAETAEAITDINRGDSDALLAAEDAGKPEMAEPPKPAKPPKKHRKFWHLWLPLIIIVCLAIVAAIPASRYYVLNHLGVHGEASLVVVNSDTGMPVKNATIELGSWQATTDASGRASLGHAELGPQQLVVGALAFARFDKTVTIAFGQNSLGKISLKPTGVSYKFKLTDYLSGQPIVGAEASSGDSSAPSDPSGLAVLPLENTGAKNYKIKFTASGYNPKTVSVTTQSSVKTSSLELTPSGRDYFINNGDVSSVNLDGTDQKTVLTNVTTNGSSQLIASDDGSLLALASTDGSTGQSLTIISTKTDHPQQLASADSIELIGWLDGQTLVYITSQACDGGQTCASLNSYDFASGTAKKLASASSFSFAEAIDNRVYYVTGTNYQVPQLPEFTVVNSDGTDREVILEDNFYKVYRVSYDQLDLAALGQWYGYDLASGDLQKISAPPNPASQFFVASPDYKNAALAGPGGLEIYSVASDASKPLGGTAGASLPVRWVGNDKLIYRSGSSDYAVSLAGGQPRKVADVSNVGGASVF